MEKITLSPISEDNWVEATVGKVTFGIGTRDSSKEKLPTTLIAFKKIFVQGKELNSREFVHEAAKALDAAGMGTNHYDDPASVLKAIRQIIACVARRTLALPFDTLHKHEHTGVTKVSPSLLKFR